ncbi:ATP-binding cassette domain-containing protein [Ferrimonas aestuarii]|uniref:ATP-binding cassette domain-containing protein n=1 Tax=Ferrimonas aestuarii TaxID=2569539 RepID=A0A4U1BIC3_9GAMM|nr:ATP-binding cassette domain-containing protein [Ferrimonas aestuarii]TKB50843.1 ATP-binding cassette domain-containing protein [Ferrimonas aestuarii]
MTPLLEVKQLSKRYPAGYQRFRKVYNVALEPISFELYHNETLAFVGEAGSGRTTLARILAGAERRSGGEILLNGELLEMHNYKQRCRLIRMIFQDPSTSLNPRLRIGQLLEEPLKFNTNQDKAERQRTIENILMKVGLLREHKEFYPHMISHGQRQRVAIARALMLDPKIIISDEALSGLDSSLRAQCVNLLLELQKTCSLSYILMSHDLATVKHMSDRVIVLKHGKVVEQGKTTEVFANPQHDYTRRLIDEQMLTIEYQM